MLESAELALLSAWCRPRAMQWHPLARDHDTFILLEPSGARQCWTRILLTRVDDEYELTTETGELLACASDLNSVLDALEGGIAEPVTTTPRPAAFLRSGTLVL